MHCVSLLRYMTQGGKVVLRDEKNRVVHVAAPINKRLEATKGWRRQLREATETDTGNILLAHMLNIALGNPQQTKLPDGTVSEWTIPTVSEQRQAAQWLLEFDKGKAVAQSEVLQAEMASEDLEQYRSLSDQAIIEAARPYLERASKGLPTGEKDEPSED